MSAPAQVCPQTQSLVAACWSQCSQCPQMVAVWEMVAFPAFAGLSPAVLVARYGCTFDSGCYRGCGQCPAGMPAAWYVQVLACDLPLSPAVLIPQGGCRFSSCCPAPPRTAL